MTSKIRTAVLAVLFLITFMAQDQAQAQSKEKVFGISSGWISRNQSALAGLYFQYSFSDHFRIEPSANIAFRKQDRDALIIDVNAHVPFRTSSRVELYPLAGVNYSTWSHHINGADRDSSDDVTTRVSRFGINAGAGLGIYATPTLKIIFEAKCSLLKGYTSARITAGIGYVF